MIITIVIAGVFSFVENVHAQTLKTTRNREFNKPVFFDPSDEEVLAHPQIAYKMLPQVPGELTMGPIVISENTFFFEYKSWLQLLGQKPKKNNVDSLKSLYLAWPKDLFIEGTVELISSGGRTLWKKDFNLLELDEFQKWLEEKKKINPVPAPALGTVSKLRLKIDNIDKEAFWKDNPAFKICISNTDKKYSSRLCSRTLRTRSTQNDIILGKIRPDGAVQVMVNNQPAELEGAESVDFKKDVSFYGRLASGETYEFYSKPLQIELADFSFNPKTDTVEIVGYDIFPFTTYTLINQKTYSSFIESIGFEQTIGDTRKFWRSNLKKSDQRIYFPGQGGGVFGYLLNIDAFPKFQARPHLSTKTMPGTYKNNVRLFGRKQPASEVDSTENSVTTSNDPTRFDWYFKATEANKYNRSELSVKYEGKTFKSYYEMYRGYANEISARLTAVPGTSYIVFMGEAAYNLWFEDFLWLEKSEWAKQRWGISTKYFNTLTPFKVKNATGASVSSDMTIMTADVKYRFLPGLWTRDETTGAMFSYQDVTFNNLEAPMLGMGWFWARSMPRVIDDIFNLFPFMSYPKWVDMEVIYYPMVLGSGVTITGPNAALNFHGQVLWKPNFFGEAGFGIKQYSYASTSVNLTGTLTMAYGTVGIGYKF